MNETLKIIKNRFSCRDFTEQQPTKEQLTMIAQAAIQSPSGMNRQFWHVIIITNSDLLSEMEQEAAAALYEMDQSFYQRVMSRSGAVFYHAPCMVLFAVKPAQPAGSELIDLGIIAQNTVLAATSLGLASLHCGLVNLAFAGTKRLYFKDKLEFPEGYECGMAVLLGTAKTSSTPHEPDSAKITFIE